MSKGRKKDGRTEAKEFKRIIIVERGNKCERCGTTNQIQYHHRNHDRRINTLENAELLCDSCHKYHHQYEDPRVTDYSKPPTHYLPIIQKKKKREKQG